MSNTELPHSQSSIFFLFLRWGIRGAGQEKVCEIAGGFTPPKLKFSHDLLQDVDLVQRCCHIVCLALWLLLLCVLNSGIPTQCPFSCNFVGWEDMGPIALASESLSISGGNASVINARPGTTAEVGAFGARSVRASVSMLRCRHGQRTGC